MDDFCTPSLMSICSSSIVKNLHTLALRCNPRIQLAHVELFRNAISLCYLKISTRLCENVVQCLNVVKRLDTLERVEIDLTVGLFGLEEKVWCLDVDEKIAQLSEALEALSQLKNLKKLNLVLYFSSKVEKKLNLLSISSMPSVVDLAIDFVNVKNRNTSCIDFHVHNLPHVFPNLIRLKIRWDKKGMRLNNLLVCVDGLNKLQSFHCCGSSRLIHDHQLQRLCERRGVLLQFCRPYKEYQEPLFCFSTSHFNHELMSPSLFFN